MSNRNKTRPPADETALHAIEQAMALLLTANTFADFEDAAFEKGFNLNTGELKGIWQRAQEAAGRVALKVRHFEAGAKGKGLDVVSAASITPESIDWIWRERLAKGKLTILAGDPGQGKSQISLSVSGAITRGRKFPDDERAPKGSVIILSAEDGAADTTVPRLMAAGADLSKVHLIRAAVEEGKKRTFSLKTDITRLDALISKLGDVALVVVDPVTSYLADVDNFRTNEVRGALEPLGALAEKHGVAVLMISHPPKAAQAKAVNAVTGSLAFVAAARMAFVAIADSTIEGRSLLLPVKTNVGRMAPGLGYCIEARTVDGPKGPIETSAVVWDDDPVTVTADEALALDRDARKPSKPKDAARELLERELAFGERPAKELLAIAKAQGVSERTLDRAKAALGVVTGRKGFGKGSAVMWQLAEVNSNVDSLWEVI